MPAKQTGSPMTYMHQGRQYIVVAVSGQGAARDVEGYIRESITTPSAHLVPGEMFSAGGVSFMPNTYGEALTEEQVDQLVAYLASLK